jgi:hypothetical protein
MRLSFVLAAIAWIALFVAGQVSALPGAEFCLDHPESPLCGGPFEEPPVVDPGDPEPEPCTGNPLLCDPPVAEVDPEPEAPSTELAGPARFKGPGFNRPAEAFGTLSYDAATFSLDSNLSCDPALGTVVAKGPSGKKFQLFPDDASLDAWAESMAFSARVLAGRGGEPVGKTAKVILKENADGTLTLRIKVQVVVEELGEVVYKATLTTVDPAATPETARILCR